jgi:hypothetical protein|tara:strand:+ start:300 stop:431 length:132 start_codon:yes stop_codon:yes gene_type:complete
VVVLVRGQQALLVAPAVEARKAEVVQPVPLIKVMLARQEPVMM